MPRASAARSACKAAPKDAADGDGGRDGGEVRGEVREKALKWGLSQSAKVPDAEDPKGTYQLYYEFEYRIDRVKPYQILALNRGESEKVLRVRVNVADRDWLQAIQQKFRPNHRSPLAEQIEMAATDAAKRAVATPEDSRVGLFAAPPQQPVPVRGIAGIAAGRSTRTDQTT